MRRIILFSLMVFSFVAMAPSALAGRGCCSWHGGQSYCASNGRWVCQDGTYSPSCTCTPPPTNPTPIAKPVVSSDESAILSEVNASKNAYQTNPDGYREWLLSNLESRYGSRNEAFIAKKIYTILQDIR